MLLGINFLELLQHAVIDPSFISAVWIALFFFLVEIASVLPSTIVLTSQAVFLPEVISPNLVMKLVFLVAIPTGLGTCLGSLLHYCLAYFGGKPAIERFKKYLRFSWKDVEKFEAHFKDNWYDELIFLALRIIPFIPSAPISVVAGILRMKFTTYVVLTIVGASLRTLLLITLIHFGFEGLF